MNVIVVYILFSAKVNKYYVGQTDDLTARLLSHNSGLSPFTSIANDWKLVYSENFKTRSESRKRESNIKRKKSRKYIEWLISNKIKS